MNECPSEVVVNKMLPLVEVSDWGYYVLISHEQIDGLIGRLMQMYELMGDIEQRNALKRETKSKIRDWLNDQYSDAGYDKMTDRPRTGYNPVKI